MTKRNSASETQAYLAQSGGIMTAITYIISEEAYCSVTANNILHSAGVL